MPPRNGRKRAEDLADNLIKSIEGAEGKEAREVKGTLRDLLEDPATFTLKANQAPAVATKYLILAYLDAKFPGLVFAKKRLPGLLEDPATNYKTELSCRFYNEKPPNNLVETYKKALSLVPIGWDLDTWYDAVKVLLPDGAALVEHLRRLRLDWGVARDRLPSDAAAATSPVVPGAELSSTLGRRGSSSATKDRGQRRADAIKMGFDGPLVGYYELYGRGGLGLLHGLAPAVAWLWVTYLPRPNHGAAVTLGTLRKAVRPYKELSQRAGEIAKDEPDLFVRDDHPPLDVVWLWTPDQKLDPRSLSAVVFDEVIVPKLLVERFENALASRVQRLAEAKKKEHGEIRADRAAYELATEKLMYLTSALEAFTRNGGVVEALPSLGDAPVELAPHYVDPSWCPAELVTLWLALGDALFGTEDQYWLRVKLVALFGLRPPAAALAVPSNFGHCGRGLQMCVLGEGAKANPYVAGASPRALSLSGFSPEQLEPLDLDTQAILRAMRDRATTVDAAMERRGLPRFPGDVLYRLRHARVRDLCEAMAPGEEWEIQVLLGHYDATSMYDYALLSPQAALEGDLYEPQPSQTKQSPAPWQ